MAHRYRMYPTKGQEVGMRRHCADARDVWNTALEQFNLYRPSLWAAPSSNDRYRQLAEARADSRLGEGSSKVQQQALRDFDQALSNWWGGSHGRPTWRSAGKNEGFRSVSLVVRKMNGKWGEVLVPKVGYVRFRLSRPMPGGSRSARVTFDRSGRWHISLTAPQPVLAREPTGASVGLDMGVAATVTASDGTTYQALICPPAEVHRRRRLQRDLARQVKGSQRYEQTRLAIAKLSAREADRRRDFIEKTTTDLVRDYDLIAIEDLKVKKMTRSAKGTTEDPGKNVALKSDLNRQIMAQGWYEFRKRLEEKAATCGVEVVAVNPAFTSQKCSSCGHTDKKNRKTQATFRCVSCGHYDNADINAARNILAAGQAVSGRGGSNWPVEASTQPVAA